MIASGGETIIVTRSLKRTRLAYVIARGRRVCVVVFSSRDSTDIIFMKDMSRGSVHDRRVIISREDRRSFSVSDRVRRSDRGWCSSRFDTTEMILYIYIFYRFAACFVEIARLRSAAACIVIEFSGRPRVLKGAPCLVPPTRDAFHASDATSFFGGALRRPGCWLFGYLRHDR